MPSRQRKLSTDINDSSLSFESSASLLYNRKTTAAAKKRSAAKKSRIKKLRANQQEFSQKWVEKDLPIPERRTTYYDLKVKYLVLEVMPSGQKTYRYLRVYRGRREMKTIGRTTDFTVTEARVAAEHINSELINGTSFSSQREAMRAEMTLGDLFEYYHTHKTDRTSNTPYKLRQESKHYWSPLFDYKLTAITTKMLQCYLSNELNHGEVSKDGKTSPYKGNKAITGIKAAWKFTAAQNSDQIKHNPTLPLSTKKELSRKTIIEGNDQFSRFFNSVDSYPDERMRDFIYLLLYTAVRSGKVLAMQWKDVNLETGVCWQTVHSSYQALGSCQHQAASNRPCPYLCHGVDDGLKARVLSGKACRYI